MPRRSLSALIALGVLAGSGSLGAAPPRNGDGRGHCSEPFAQGRFQPCGSGTGGLTTASGSEPAPGAPVCTTVVVVQDTQWLMTGATHPRSPDDPTSFADPEQAKDYDDFKQIVRWIVQEAPRERENVAFVLHVGDIVQRRSRGNRWGFYPLPKTCVEPCARWSGGPDPQDGFGKRCYCKVFHNREPEWERFTREWARLDRVVPYAVIAGNHDNVGFLAGDHDGHDLPDAARRERPGYADFFPPARLDEALGAHEGAERVDTHVVYASQVGDAPVSNPDPSFRRRGLSHSWRFELGPHRIGVMGLDMDFMRPETPPPRNRRAEADSIAKSRAWAEAQLAGPLAGLPVLFFSHYFGDGGYQPRTAPRWHPKLRDLALRVENRGFWLAEGHSGPPEYGFFDRDASRPEDDDRMLLWTRSLGGGIDAQKAGPYKHAEPQVFAVRFIFRTLAENQAQRRDRADPQGVLDEVAIYEFTPDPRRGRLAPPGPGLAGFTRRRCVDFSIFYDDRDYDGVPDHLDACPRAGDPCPPS